MPENFTLVTYDIDKKHPEFKELPMSLGYRVWACPDLVDVRLSDF